MKNICFYLAFLLLIIGCSTNNDDGTNSTTTIIPLAPTNLSGTNVASMEINLTWTDNSTNETGFIIERKTASTNYIIVGNTSVNITKFTDTGLVNNTPYTYRVYSTNSVGNSLTYSNEFKITPFGAPVLTTSVITSITSVSAVCGGNITDNGGFNVSARGIVWSTNPNPTTFLTTKTEDNSGSGVFISNLTSLSPNTTYYVRAYAKNIKGTGYGNEISFTTAPLFINGGGVTDICGNNYSSIILGKQEWMKRNLDVCKYRNGDIIPQVQNLEDWKNLTTGAWCYYENNSANGSTYGKLYNGYALNDPRGLAPQGWHVANSSEWNNLIMYLGGYEIAGGRMKEAGTSHWTSPNTGATNESGFTGLPGGTLEVSYVDPIVIFRGKMDYVYFWTTDKASVSGGNTASGLVYNSAYYTYGNDALSIKSGFYIRCVKD